jgi:tetratricopeptide (TPR) repeat protein
VIGYYSMDMMAKIEENILEAGKSMGADYILAGSIQYSGNTIRIRINLLITATGEVILTKSFDRDLLSSSIFSIQDEIIPAVIGALGGYYGLLFQEMEKTSPLKALGNAKIRSGVSSYYNYQRSFTVENFNLALTSLREAITEYPDHPESWAMLGELYLDGIGLRLKTLDDPLAESYQCVLRSLKIDPLCQHAWHTLARVQLYRREKGACRQSARRCIELNPNCSVLVAGAAVTLICAGFFDEGFPILEKASKFSPYSPWWINRGFCYYFLYKKDYPSALSWIEKMSAEESYLDSLIRSATLSFLNKTEAAEKYLAKLLILEPETPARIRDMLSTFILSEELITQLLAGLEKIGLRV